MSFILSWDNCNIKVENNSLVVRIATKYPLSTMLPAKDMIPKKIPEGFLKRVKKQDWTGWNSQGCKNAKMLSNANSM